MKTAKDDVVNESEQAYWLYPDGEVYWGTNAVRFGEEGVKVDRELRNAPVEVRLEWLAGYKVKQEAEASKAKEGSMAEAEAKAKQEAEARAKAKAKEKAALKKA